MKTMRLARISALVLGAVVALAGVATASAQEGVDEVGSEVTSFGVSDWLNLGLRLALVIGVIWAAVHAMRWWVRRMNRGNSRGGMRALEVLETHTLGPNRTLHLVRLGDRAVLVGATQERITQLLTVDDPEEFKRLTETPEDDGDVTTVTRTAPALSVFSALRTGLMAMRANQVQMSERIKAQREIQREVQREAKQEPRTTRRAQAGARVSAKRAAPEVNLEAVEEPSAGPRFGALKGVLARAQRPPRATRPAPRTSEQIIEAAADERESLFDRTLASIEALEVMPNGSTAAGARARASYGPARPGFGGDSAASTANAGRPRDARIADLQRAIAQARKSAS